VFILKRLTVAFIAFLNRQSGLSTLFFSLLRSLVATACGRFCHTAFYSNPVVILNRKQITRASRSRISVRYLSFQQPVKVVYPLPILSPAGAGLRPVPIQRKLNFILINWKWDWKIRCVTYRAIHRSAKLIWAEITEAMSRKYKFRNPTAGADL